MVRSCEGERPHPLSETELQGSGTLPALVVQKQPVRGRGCNRERREGPPRAPAPSPATPTLVDSSAPYPLLVGALLRRRCSWGKRAYRRNAVIVTAGGLWAGGSVLGKKDNRHIL